jgi:hypothetical protein
VYGLNLIKKNVSEIDMIIKHVTWKYGETGAYIIIKIRNVLLIRNKVLDCTAQSLFKSTSSIYE